MKIIGTKKELESASIIINGVEVSLEILEEKAEQKSSGKKYEFTGVTIDWYGRTLHRIKALKSFGKVKEGEEGGWIESEKNLSHEGDCWVSGDACVFGNARVSGNAWVSGSTKLSSGSHT